MDSSPNGVDNTSPGNSAQASQPNKETENRPDVIRARCLEKEGKVAEAKELFIALGLKDDALRCSAKRKFICARRKKNWRIALLAIFSGIMILAFIVSLVRLNKNEREIIYPSVNWNNPGNVNLAGYPSWFLYDDSLNQISTRKMIDDASKLDIVNAYPWAADSTNFTVFRQAVDKLAFESSGMMGRNFWLLLLVSGLASVVGVFIREILDLIRHHCYDKDLDFRIWWPWYVLRPLVGFMVGVMIVLFSGSNLLIDTSGNNSETYLVAIAVIAGISVEDVMFKLRKVSQVLFGNSNTDSPPGSGAGPKTAATAGS